MLNNFQKILMSELLPQTWNNGMLEYRNIGFKKDRIDLD